MLEGSEYYKFAMLAGESHYLIFILIYMAAPFIKTIVSASAFAFSAASTLAIGILIVKAPTDKLKQGPALVAILVLGTVGLLNVEVDLDHMANMSSDKDRQSTAVGETIHLPAIIYYPWKGFASAMELYTSAIRNTSRSAHEFPQNVSMFTGLMTKASAEMFGDEWGNLQTSYMDYTSTCSVSQDKMKILNIDEKYLHAIGLNGGSGIFIQGKYVSEYDNLSEEIAHGLTHVKSSLPLIAPSPFSVKREYTYSKVETVQTIPEIIYGLVTKEPSEAGLESLAYQGSRRKAEDSRALMATGLTFLEAKKQLDSHSNNALFHPDDCVEMYSYVHSQIGEFQKYMIVNGRVPAMEHIGFSDNEEAKTLAASAASSLLLQALKASKDKDNAFQAASYNANNPSRGEGSGQGAVEVFSDLTNSIQNLKMLYDTWNLQFTIPMTIVTACVFVMVCFMVLPILISLSPIMGPGIIVNGMKILGILYLALFIFQLIMMLGNHYADKITMLAIEQMSGPGGKVLSILLLQSSLGLIMITAGGSTVLIFAYMIISGKGDALRQMKAPRTADGSATVAAGVAVGKAAATAIPGAGSAILAQQAKPKTGEFIGKNE